MHSAICSLPVVTIARSRYDYLLDTLRLKQAAGILAATDLAQVNELLVEYSKYVTP